MLTYVWLCAAAWAWPSDRDWVALTTSGSAVVDATGDQPVDHDDALDLAGDPLAPALLWYADADDAFFRLQVAGDPKDGSLFVPGTWGLLLDLDADPTTFEYVIDATGVTAQLEAWENDGTPGVDVAFEHYEFVALLDDEGGVRRTENGGYFTVDLRVSRQALYDHLGIGDVDAVRIVAFTGSSVFSERSDVTACDGAVSTCGDLDSVTSSPVYLDRDEDDLTDPAEATQGAVATDADTDDDGVLDGHEPLGDVDGDGWANAVDCDSDADGVYDGTEAGLSTTDLHPHTNLGAGCFAADQDTVADPSDAWSWDTDGGQLSDGLEDWNANGRLDPPWETDPTDPADDLDSDGDSIADVLELQGDDGSVNDVDSDGDGITDAVEWLWDDDDDGVPAFLDLDSDADGLADAIEGDGDADGDGAPSFRDLDSDGDGIADAVETDSDTDEDGTADFLDTDADDDGIADADEGIADPDEDGLGNWIDEDSDDDAMLDEDEGDEDPDEDGIPNYLDEDSDQDTIPDDVETDDDEDRDDTPNFLDSDSDDDGTSDAAEGLGDADCDGIPNYLDDDNDDGFCDSGLDEPGVVEGFEVDDTESEGFSLTGGQFTGGACSSAPLSAGWLPMALALLGLGRRGLVRRSGLALLAFASVPASAQEMGLDAQRFAPSPDNRTFVGVEDTVLANAWTGGGTLFVNHADDPFVFRPEDSSLDETDILGAVTTADLVGFYSFGIARIGLDVPIHLNTTGFGVPRATNTGDIEISGKATFFEAQVGDLSLGCGALAGLTLPTGAPAAWVGSGQFGGTGAAIASLRWDRLVAAVNLGVRSGADQAVQDLTMAPAFRWQAGVGAQLPADFWVSTELNGERWFGNAGQAVAPSEWLAAVRYAPWSNLLATVGGGSGLSRGVGAPDYRVIAAIGWTPGRVVEPPPPPPVEPVSVEGVPPLPGDVVIRAADPSGRPVRGAEVRILGTLGKPMITGNDGILEAELEPGDYEVAIAATGWIGETQLFTVPEGGSVDLMVVLHPEEVVVDKEAGQIFLHRKVFFEIDKAELKLESLHVLDSLVETLQRHPEIAMLRVEGHTDTTGTDRHNQLLSDARARSVVRYLMQQGIAPERLSAKGFGETRVLQEGDSEFVHATNRRVEFHIVEEAAALEESSNAVGG